MSELVQAKPDANNLSIGAKLSVLALSILGLAGGWLIALNGGFYSETYRRSGLYTFVDGEMALLMAVIQLSFSAIGIVALLKDAGFSRTTCILAALSVVVPPVVIGLSFGA